MSFGAFFTFRMYRCSTFHFRLYQVLVFAYLLLLVIASDICSHSDVQIFIQNKRMRRFTICKTINQFNCELKIFAAFHQSVVTGYPVQWSCN